MAGSIVKQRRVGLRMALTLVLLGSLTSLPAQAVTRSMVGSLGVLAPSVEPPFLFEVGPAIFGKGQGPYAPSTGARTVSVAGTTTGTFVGRGVTVGANELAFSGVRIRDFPAFPGVGNLTLSFMSTHPTWTFMEGAGALAACPGPGCTSSGSGTAISWCPPLAQPAGTPAPGTAANQVGDWDCASWPAGAGGGNRFQRFAITNVSGRNKFGGTMQLLRNHLQNLHRVLVQPGTDGIGEVRRNIKVLNNFPWRAGASRFVYQTSLSDFGPRLFARLNANGAVTETLGCVNPTGTPGGTFMLGVPILNFGSNCGTPTIPTQGVQSWGFPFTTGTVSGSDPFPFGLVITTALPPGTPLAPNAGTQPGSAGFFFTRMGTDRVTGTVRNLVLLGGGVATDPPSGNAFFRINDLRLQMSVPEPAMGLGLLLGAVAVVGLGRRRI